MALKDILIKIKGDNKDFKKKLDNSDKSMSGFAGSMRKHSTAIAASIGTMAAGFVAFSVKAAAAEEAVSRQTEALLKSQGILWNDVSGHLDGYMKNLEKLTSYNDTDLQLSFNKLIALGMDYNTALNTMSSVTNFAYTMNMDLENSALLLAKAYKGETGSLSRYGIVLDSTLTDQEKWDEIIRMTTEDMADATERSDGLEGSMGDLKNQMYNVSEVLGTKLLPVVTDFTTVVTGIVESGVFTRVISSMSGMGQMAFAWGSGIALVINQTLLLGAVLRGSEDDIEKYEKKAGESFDNMITGFKSSLASYKEVVTGMSEIAQSTDVPGITPPTIQTPITPTIPGLSSVVADEFKSGSMMTAASKGVSASEYSGGQFKEWSEAIEAQKDTKDAHEENTNAIIEQTEQIEKSIENEAERDEIRVENTSVLIKLTDAVDVLSSKLSDSVMRRPNSPRGMI